MIRDLATLLRQHADPTSVAYLDAYGADMGNSGDPAQQPLPTVPKLAQSSPTTGMDVDQILAFWRNGGGR